MKAKITRQDGTVVELEGSAEEIRRILEPPISVTVTPWLPPWQPARLFGHEDTLPFVITCGITTEFATNMGARNG